MEISKDEVPPAYSEKFENERLHALLNTQLLDSAPNARFDNITNLVASVFRVPIALISLVDENRQWFLSRKGLTVNETPRCDAFCAKAINNEQLLVIEDASTTSEFADNPLVTGPPNIRFYAGAVIRDDDGYPLGTLCIIDTIARTLDENEKNVLLSFCDLARQEVLLPTNITTDRLKARLKLHLDPVTNTLLDDAFFKAADEVLEKSDEQRAKIFVSIKVCDLGWINNTHSKHVADEVLLEIITRFRNGIPASFTSIFGRVGSSTLCAFLNGDHAEEDLAATLQNIKRSLSGVVTTSDMTISTSIKVAMTQCRLEAETAQEAFKFTHLSLKAMPDKAGVQTCFVSEQEKAQLQYRLTLGRDLSWALKNNQLHLVFQPKVCARTHQVVGIEALLRWHHDTLGNIAPNVILDTATDGNLLYELEQWVFTTACRHIRNWLDKGLRVPTVSVNITGETLLRTSFADFAEQSILRFDLHDSALDLEIVEGSIFKEFDTAVQVMRRLIHSGITFSLDDFGTGFSSLSYLRNLPIKNLKIDKSFVDDIIESQEAATLCGGIIALAKSLQLNIVAEGVETESQAIVLKALRCDSFQGYYFHKPLDIKALEALL